MVCVVIPTLGWKDRLALGGAGFGLVIYGIYVANQDSGYFTFPVEIFLIPFIALGYAGWQSWVWAWQKWPGGLSDVAESINQLGSGSTSSGSQPTNVGRAPGGVTDPNLRLRPRCLRPEHPVRQPRQPLRPHGSPEVEPEVTRPGYRPRRPHQVRPHRLRSVPNRAR